MMKMMILAPRRGDLSHAEFRRYVTEVHGPLVQSVPEVVRAIRRYHYNFPIHAAKDTAFHHPSASHLDIVTQGWFDSHAAQLANMREPRYLEIVRPDEARFADTANAVMHYTAEHSVVEGAATGVKVFYFRRRRAGLSRAEFQEQWQARAAAALRSNFAFEPTVCKYLQNHTLPESDHPDGAAEKFFDVIDEIFIRTPASLTALADDRAAVARMAACEEELLDRSRTRALVTETVVNIA